MTAYVQASPTLLLKTVINMVAGRYHSKTYPNPVRLATRILCLGALLVTFSTVTAQPTPTVSVALQAWKRYVDSSLQKVTNYHLEGVIENSNPVTEVNSEISGSWEVIANGEKFKWKFSVPPSTPKILSYDGKRWWLYGKSSPITDSAIGGDQNGKILINPKKVLAKDPRQPYVDGLVQVYPIDLIHLLKNPTHSASITSTPDEYLARMGKVSIRNTVFDGKKAFQLSIEKDKIVSKIAIPEIIYLAIFDSQFVPIGFEHRTTTGLIVKTHLKEYESKSTLAYPKQLITEIFGHDSAFTSKLLVSSKINLNISEIGKQFPDSEFQIAFPVGTIVWNEEKRDAYKVGGKLSKDIQATPAHKEMLWPSYAGIALLLLSIILITYSTRRRYKH